MLNVSKAFNDAMAKDERFLYSKVIIKTNTGDVVLNNDAIKSIELDTGISSGSDFPLGQVYSDKLSTVFTKIYDNFEQDQEVRAYIGIETSSGSIEYAPLGVFFINEIKIDRNNKRTTLECVDAMNRLNGKYGSKLSFPATVRDIVLDICNRNGIELDSDKISANAVYMPKDDVTDREALSMMAQIESGFVKINREGKLEIRKLVDKNFIIPKDNYFLHGLEKNEILYKLGGISVTRKNGNDEDETLHVGSDKGPQISLKNQAMTTDLLKNVYVNLQKINYYPFSLNWQGNPAIEAGDWLNVELDDGKFIKLPNLNYKLSFNGGMKASSSADTKIDSSVSFGYKGAIKQQIEWIEAQVSANGRNNTFTGTDEPKKPQKEDLWYKPNGPEMEMWEYDGEKWVLRASTADTKEAQESADHAKAEAELAKQQADTAVNTANNAVTEAGFSKETAEQAKQQAQDSFNKAQNALTNSINANTAANDAKNIANSAKQSADKTFNELAIVKDDAGKALSNAKDALDAYSKIKIGGRNYWIIANSSKGYVNLSNGVISPPDAKNLVSDFIEIDVTKDYIYQFWTTIKANVNSWTGAGFYDADKKFISRWNDYPLIKEDTEYYQAVYFSATKKAGFILIPANTKYIRIGSRFLDVTGAKVMFEQATHPSDYYPAQEDFDNSLQVAVTNINGELSQKVSQNDYNVLKGTVTSQGTAITQNKTDIASKADKTVVDTLKGTVDKQGTAITQNSKDIALKASQSTVDTLTGRVSSTESQLTIQAGQIATKVTKADVDSQINSKGFATQSEVKQTADKINSTISKVETDLSNRIGNLLNNTTLTGTLDRWSKNPSFTVKQADFQGVVVPVQSIVTNGNVLVSTDLIAVDPAKTYEISLWLKSLQDTKGSDYLGIYVYDKDKKIRGITTVNPLGKIGNAADTNPYFYSTTMPGKHLDWAQWTGYIMPAGTDPITLKGKGTYNNFIMYPFTAYIAVRWLNYYNNGVEREVLVANPKMIEVSSDTLAQISQVEQTIDGVKTTVATKADASQVQQLADRVTTTVTKLDNLQVGSRNHLLNSDFSNGDKNWRAWAPSGAAGVRSPRPISWLNGFKNSYSLTMNSGVQYFGFAQDNVTISGSGEYTSSVWINVQTGTDVVVALEFGPDNGKYHHLNIPVKTEDNWKRVSFTHEVSNLQKLNVYYGVANSVGATVLFTGMQFEKGNVASDWSRSPDEQATQDDITKQQTQIDQTAAAIKLKADQTTVNAIAGRVTTAESQLSVQAKEIASKVTETQVNNLVDGKGFATQTWTNSQITQTANSIKQTVSQVQSEVDTLKITDRNLFIFSKITDDRYIDDTGTLISINSVVTSDFIEVVANEKYTFSQNGLTSNHRIAFFDASKKYLHRIIPISANPHTLTIPSGVKYVRYSPSKPASKPAPDGYYKVERGDKATPWTCAPEDVASKESVNFQFSTIEQTIKGIQSTVANKAEQSQVTQLANQITSTVKTVDGHTSQITQMGKDINLRVTQAQVEAEILKDKTVKDTRNDNQPPSWYYANYTKQTAEEFKYRVKIEAPGTTTYGQFTTDVPWTDISGGSITQTFKSADGVFQRRSANTTTWSAWEKVADANKLINQINISNEGILIAGNKIHIQGTTKIDNAVITSAMIKDVVADKIQTGTLNAANVDIINLNASNIVTGTLSANLIKIGFNNISGAVNIDQEGIDVTGDSQRIHFGANGMQVFNNKGQLNGHLGVAYNSVDPNKNGIMIAAEAGKEISLNRKVKATDAEYAKFLEIPSNKDVIQMNYPVKMYNKLDMTNQDIESTHEIRFDHSRAKMWGSGSSGTCINYNNTQLQLTDGGIYARGNFYVVGGSKNAAITVRDGTRLMYAYETAEYYHGDLGENQTINCECKVNIETLFSDTIDLDKPYHVFVSSYSDAHVWVSERTATHFIVKSDKDTSFSWEIKAKRRGYADERLKLTDISFKEAFEGVKNE